MEKDHWLEVRAVFGRILKMTKVLITGNSGYIGSHLSKILLKNSDINA